MYTGRNYPIKQTLLWTKKYIGIFFCIGLIPILIIEFLPKFQIPIPWLSVSLIGIAVAFYLGFKNNASYDRLWEARKIWGGIVNDSRTWAMMVKGYVRDDFKCTSRILTIHRRLVLRHLAWLHALRFQLRKSKQWEHYQTGRKASKNIPKIEEREYDILDIISKYLPEKEIDKLISKKKWSTHILDLQMQELTELRSKKDIDDFRHVELGNVLRRFYELQGKCERIKNFPFPRQYASLNIYFVWIFIVLLPFGLVPEFLKFGENFVWLSLPFSVLISWVFHTMELIGDYSENPFEGLNNDIPITAITRTIEIDLLQMIEEINLPDALTAKDNVLM